MKYPNRPISVVKLAQRDIGNGRKGFANASDYLETWDDSDNITAVIAQKYWDIQKWWDNHSESQYQGSEINCQHTAVVETELRLGTNNPIRVYGLVTRYPDRKMRSLVLNPRRREEDDSYQKGIR